MKLIDCSTLVTCLCWLLCVHLSIVSAFPINQKIINEAKSTALNISPALGPHAQETMDSKRLTFQRQQYLHGNRRRHHRHHRKRLNWMKEALVYLRTYGYLEMQPISTDIVESGLKGFQQMAGIRETGRLDKQTIAHMRLPRCGNADIVQKSGKQRFKRFAQVSKWTNKLDQNDVLSLKWYIQKYTKDIPRNDIRNVVRRAFNLWSEQIGIPSMRNVALEFSEAASAVESDISIKWALGSHGDAYAFDNGGNKTNILAHTFYPNYQQTGSLNGDIHFDDFEKWVLDNTSTTGVHFPYVLVHEIGHALGLGHSKRQEAVMNPIYKKYSLDSIVLDLDDKCAFNWNYVINITNAAPGQNDGWNQQQSLEEKLNYTLQRLQEVNIPQCSKENNVQVQYEELLKRKLDFPRESAKLFGPVVCNFLDGLSRVVHRSNGGQNPPFSSDSVQQVTVHEYSQSSRTRVDPLVEFDEVLGSNQRPKSRSRRAHGENLLEDNKNRHIVFSDSSSTEGQSIFHKDYFSDEFYQNLLRLLSKPRL